MGLKSFTRDEVDMVGCQLADGLVMQGVKRLADDGAGRGAGRGGQHAARRPASFQNSGANSRRSCAGANASGAAMVVWYVVCIRWIFLGKAVAAAPGSEL